MNPAQNQTVQIDPLAFANAQLAGLSGHVDALTKNLAYAAMQYDALKRENEELKQKLSGSPKTHQIDEFGKVTKL